MAQIEVIDGIVLYSNSGIISNTVSGINLNISIDPKNVTIPSYWTPDNATINNLEIKLESGYFIDLTDTRATKYNDGSNYNKHEKLVLSNTFVETLDLISEGEIDSIAGGIYINSGNYGEVGWQTSIFSGYKTPQGSGHLSWLRSLYWNEIPVLNDAGQFNFQNIDCSYVKGTPNGGTLDTLLFQYSSSKGISEILFGGSENAKFYRIINKDCKAILLNVKFAGLSQTPIDGDNAGSVERTHVIYNIQYRPIFSSITKQTDFSSPIKETVFGKLSSSTSYIRSTLVIFDTQKYIDLNTGLSIETDSFLNNLDFIGWEIKVMRETPDSTTSYLQNMSSIDSITELYNSQLTYPNSALVRSKFNAEFFSSVPERAFDTNLIKVKIPKNYDPITRSYNDRRGEGGLSNGFWNGQFSETKQWTNNPAWCFYDMLTNKRYGLGRFIDSINLDKFSLYKIGQYCDQLVSDEEGGLEPRFAFNTQLNSKEEASKVINDMASVFRGMTYYANGTVFTVNDQPKKSRIIFSNTNVENGDFGYSSSSKRSRHSVSIVRYNNPKDFYKPAIEYVEDINSIRKYGIRELNLTAFACTSRAQAIRLGRWALLSNNIENETIQFNAGLEAATLMPGDLFSVVDYNRKAKRYAGRISSFNNIVNPNLGINTGAYITLDSKIEAESGIEYKLSLMTPSYNYNTTQISGLTMEDYQDIQRSFIQNFVFSGEQVVTTIDGKTKISLSTGINVNDYDTNDKFIWTVELGTGFLNYTGAKFFTNEDNDIYRTLSVKETQDYKYEVVGLKYWGGKFELIDSGISFYKR